MFNYSYDKLAILIERLNGEQKKDKESTESEFKRVNKRIDNLEGAVADLPEIKQLMRVMTENMQDQKETQKEYARTQVEFIKTQTTQSMLLEKISNNLEDQAKRFEKLELARDKDDSRVDLKIAELDKKMDMKDAEILKTTFNDKKEVMASIEELAEMIRENNEKGQIDIVEGAKSAVKYIAVAILGFLVKFFIGG